MSKYTLTNYDIVRYHIRQKQQLNIPYRVQVGRQTIPTTDMDHFPYQRFYRGRTDADSIIMFDREAGYYPRNDYCYKKHVQVTPDKTEFCWQYPCSNIKPCQSTTKGTYINTP